MHSRLALSRPASAAESLISYLYIPSGCELVSMIKKAPGEKRKFRAEYLTLSESELCRGSGRRRSEGGTDGERGRNLGVRRQKRKKRSPVAMLYTGIQRGIVSRVYANLKDPPLRLASREGRSRGSLEISTLSLRRGLETL